MNIKLEIQKISENKTLIRLTTKVIYAMVQKPTLNYSGDGYENQVCPLLDTETYLQLSDLGVTHKAKKYKEDPSLRYIKLKKDAPSRDESGVVVVDKNNKRISDIVGDGSLCTVGIQVDEFEYNGSKKTKVHLLGLRVLELVEYKKGGSKPSDSTDEALNLFLNKDDETI